VVLWLIYGIIIRSTPIIVANAFTLTLALAIIVLKIRYSRLHSRGRHDSGRL
jgi:MtN3 and saliva related transmembrane protein